MIGIVKMKLGQQIVGPIVDRGKTENKVRGLTTLRDTVATSDETIDLHVIPVGPTFCGPSSGCRNVNGDP